MLIGLPGNSRVSAITFPVTPTARLTWASLREAAPHAEGNEEVYARIRSDVEARSWKDHRKLA